jgi:hypothetical protein
VVSLLLSSFNTSFCHADPPQHPAVSKLFALRLYSTSASIPQAPVDLHPADQNQSKMLVQDFYILHPAEAAPTM